MRNSRKNLTPFERGQDDFKRGLIDCPFKKQDKIEPWLDRWKTEKEMNERK